MSRRANAGLRHYCAALVSVMLLTSAAAAQERPELTAKPKVTAEDVIITAQTAYGPPPPAPACEQASGDEIVVCGQEQDQDQFRVKSSSELDPTSEEAIKDGLPRAPDFGESCKKNPEKGPCIGFGSVPPPALIIDFSKLPEAPAGSDADRIGRGLAPLGGRQSPSSLAAPADSLPDDISATDEDEE